MRTLIIVPTYNECDNVVDVVNQFLQPIADSDLLLIDDNSPDGTGLIADKIAKENSRVHVIHRSGKLGLGTAYLTGFRWALQRDYEFIVEMDADFSHPPHILPMLVQAAKDNRGMAVGSRYVAGGGTQNWGRGRELLSRAGGRYARAVLGIDVRDVTSGFVCYQRQALEAIDLDRIRSSGYSFQIEMKYRVLRAGLPIHEVPIVFCDREKGESKMVPAIMLEALLMVWKLRFSAD